MASRKMRDKLIFAEANQLGWCFVLNGSSLEIITNHFVLLSMLHLSDPKRWCGLLVVFTYGHTFKIYWKNPINWIEPRISLGHSPVLRFNDQNGSVQFNCSIMSDSLWTHGLQNARPPCPSPTPRVHSNSCPSSWWCHLAISSSVVPFSSCPQFLPASKSFPMSQLFAWGGQSTGVSALASFLPTKSQGLSPSEWTGWISLQSKALSRVFSNTTVQKHLYTFINIIQIQYINPNEKY